jgi:hypothetical protein
VFSERTLAVIIRRPNLIVLAVVTSLAWMGCKPAVQPPVENQESPPAAQKQASTKWVEYKEYKLDDDTIRVRLLLLETVQEDLGLTADQIEKIRDCLKIAWERGRELKAKLNEIFPPSQSFASEEYEARQRELQAWYADFKSKGKELQRKLLAMLTPIQSERLKEIQLQAAIPAALFSPEIVKALELSEEQRGKIRALCDSMGKKQAAALPDLRDLNPKEQRQKYIEFMKESDKIQAEATKPVLEILTSEQQAQFDKLQGKKIEVKWSYEEWIPEDAEF